MAKRANSEGTIYQRKDGRWEAAMTLEDGKRKRFYGRTRMEVHAKLVAAQRDQQRGIAPVPEQETLGPFLDRWLETVVKRTVRTKTHYGYAQMVRDHIAPSLGKHRLARLTPQHIDQFIEQKLATGLSPKTVKHLHAVLRRALGQAEKWGLVARNVAKLAQPPAYRRPQVQALDAAQANQLLDAAASHRLDALFRVALALGLRKGELLGLRWVDVDLDRRELRVTQALQRVNHQLLFVPPKSERSRRVLPLPDFLVDALRAHRVRQIEDRLAAGPLWQESGLVFTSSTGRPLDERNVTRVFDRLLAAAELPRVRFHDLRHSCASLLLAQGVAPRVVMEILGHSQISITMDTYSHVVPALAQDAVDRVAALFAVRA